MKYINAYKKICYSHVRKSTGFNPMLFHVVYNNLKDDKQFALHTNLGSFTVLDRMTGFGHRDVETGYRSKDNKFWLASGNYDVRESGVKTIGEAIEWVKTRANNCIGI
jgi:hypothetical protein